MIHENLLNAIGNTPIANVSFDTAAHVYAKLEYLNPGGSVKDRPALYMIEYAERTGKLKPGGTIIDASSGNQGIAIAMIGSLKNYKVIITVSEKISQEKLQTMQAYGAETIMCPATEFIEDSRSYHSKAIELAKKNPNAFMPNQYFNPLNSEAHYYSLGPEIWQQTQGNITHFFAGVGTGGTISGVGRYLKEKNPDIKIIGIDSVNSYRATNGNPKPYAIEGIGIDFISPVINYSLIDDIITVSDEQAFAMLKTLARKHGLLVGTSSGAVASGVQRYFDSFDKNSVVVIIFGDSGRAYLSKDFY